MDLKTELRLVDEADVCKLRGMSLVSLRNERTRGLGPPYQRMGRKVFYPLEKLRAFLAASTVVPKRRATLIDGSRRRANKAVS